MLKYNQMRKQYIFTAAIAVLLISGSALLLPAKAEPKNNEQSQKAASVPDEINTIFKSSCYSCHSTDGKRMAMSMVNFSQWDNYSPEKQAKKATAICKTVTKGSMPPKSFIESNPDAALTYLQKDMICNWSKTMSSEK